MLQNQKEIIQPSPLAEAATAPLFAAYQSQEITQAIQECHTRLLEDLLEEL